MKTLSIIIPALNEEHTIAHVLRAVFSQNIGDWTKEVIVVNDGSTDETEQKLALFRDNITYIKHAHCQGKGTALRNAFAHVSGTAVLVQDADLEYSPADWPHLLEKLETSEVAAVFGSRNLFPDRRGYKPYVWGAHFVTWLTNIFFGAYLTDVYTCYKLIRTDALKKLSLKTSGFEIEVELTCQLLKRGYSIAEAPIGYQPRTFSEGKKIRPRDGLIGMWTVFKNRFLRPLEKRF